jgi:hypothetical protein
MTLLRYGELRKLAFAPAFDLVVYGFSADEANRILRALGHPHFARGQIIGRLRQLERPRKLSDGYTACLAKEDVKRFVLCLPSALMERPKRAGRNLPPVMTDDERMELADKARLLMHSAKMLSERVRLLRASGREWQENPSRLLQKEMGIDYC